MKQVIYLLFGITALAFAACTGPYENVDKYSGEVVYPASFDTITGHVGYERIELDFLKAGRIPSAQIKMGKASKTVIEYDGVKHYIDSVVSWTNVTGLTESKLYRIKVYTEDEFGNASVPQEVAMIPFTSLDRDLVGVSTPKLTIIPSALAIDWPNGLNSPVLEYQDLSYSYTDKNGVASSGTTKATFFVCNNLAADHDVTINITYRVIPKLSDGSKILDTVSVTKPLTVRTPTATTPFTPSESGVLRANGVATFTTEACESVTKLVYPMHVSSFADVLYFPNLRELDLTGAGIANVLPVLTYDRNAVKTQCGGGSWQPFMTRVDKPADIKIGGLPLLLSLLNSGQITKVRYIPNSLGFETNAELNADGALAALVEKGVIEFVQPDDPLFPDEVFIEPQFFVKGQPVDNNWEMTNYYSGDYFPRAGLTDCGKFNAQVETVNGDPVNLQLNQLIQSDGKNIYKCVIKMRSASFCMNLPKEYRYDNQLYKKLKFKMFCGTAASDMTGDNAKFLQAWIRPMNYMWNFANNSIYGQENWGVYPTPVSTADIRNKWTDCEVDMTAYTGGPTSNRRNRVLVFNIGNEPAAFTYVAAKEVVLYIADIRFTKN